MLVVISPAKRLDWEERAGLDLTQPEFLDDAMFLTKTARKLTVEDLQSLMGISPDLAILNRDRFKSYVELPDAEATRPAAMAFAGDTYQGLEAATLEAEDLAYAQDHLRILSGLYGVLRPLDGIQPYRLEMGSRLKTQRGKNLYSYWGDQLSKALNVQAEVTGATMLVNCASQEYFGAVDVGSLKLPVVTPMFLEEKGGKSKVVSFYAKRARGAMARFIVETRAKSVEDLQGFDVGGYRFQTDQSTDSLPVFSRPSPTA